MLNTWLSDCHEYHDDCMQNGATRELPTRLLDVGARPHDKEPRLIVTSEHMELLDSTHAPYAALSHCWGMQGTPLKTESGSLSDMMTSIPLNSMPRTYQDAVRLTRLLGIRFLWIDSLCILQDDKSDWERESAVMHDIYHNAHVTLCALVDSCDDGLFGSERSAQATVTFQSSIKPEIQGEFFLRGTMPNVWDSDLDPDHRIKHNDLTENRWSDRGWTYQEKQFSPRKLICSKRMIYYSCDSAFHSEDKAFDEGVYGHTIMGMLRITDRAWESAVFFYSGRSLTFVEDRFPAISSFASTIAQVTGDTYFAGLWKSNLHRELLWWVLDQPRQFPKKLPDLISELQTIQPFIAPSWSWACRGKHVDWFMETTAAVPEFKTIEAYVDVDGLNAFGRILGATLILFAKYNIVYNLSLYRPTWPLYLASNTDGFLAKWVLDWLPTAAELESTTAPAGIVMLLTASVPAKDGARQADVKDFERYCKEYSFSKDWPGERLYGLLLYPTDKGDEFRRIGTFETVNWEKGGRAFFDAQPFRNIKLV